MTDVAESKYGFDPNDASSFPGEPEPVILERHSIDGAGIDVYFEAYPRSVEIKWTDPAARNYRFGLRTADSAEWNIVYGGHHEEVAPVPFQQFNLTGDESLIGRFWKYDSGDNLVGVTPNLTIDLCPVIFPQIGDPANSIGYAFSDNFPSKPEAQYREFLRRVFPILYEYLGPPAETFNILIDYRGEDSGYFIVIDGGRTLVTDADFIPRLIVHELIHAWKGNFTITSDESWIYDTSLSGFEEGMAEGMAFEIVHEYVRSYPNDPASIQLLEHRPTQYWAGATTYYDAIKNVNWTGAGDFWTHAGGQINRFSIAATTIQMMIRENKNFIKDFMHIYYETIREDRGWRPNRDDIISMWETLVPELNGYPLREYLSTVPVFNGRKLDEGAYVLETIRPYGVSGDQQFALSYAIPDGRLEWGILKNGLKDVPEWIKTGLGDDGYYYVDTQDSRFLVEVNDAYGKEHSTYDFRTERERYPDGSPRGFGWLYVDPLRMQNFPSGCIRKP